MDKFFLDMYNNFGKTGKLSETGLCVCVSDKDVTESRKYYNMLQRFEPNWVERQQLVSENISETYWGSGLKITDSEDERHYSFTPLRQTILLFCHEILNSND